MVTKIKHWVIRTFFKPAHVGTFMREMYAKKYLPDEVMKKGNISVLDAGCGKGQYAMFVADRAPSAHILAVDIQRFSEWTTYRKYPNIDFQEMDLHNYDEHEVRDLTVSIDVLEHVLDNTKVMAQLCRGLKKGGYLYFAIPCDDTAPHIFPKKWFGAFHEWEEDEHIGDQLTLQQWRDFIGKQGLVIKKARYTFTYWGTLAWEVEFLLRASAWGRRFNVLLMPFYYLLAQLDIYMPLGKGNNLIVAQKIDSVG